MFYEKIITSGYFDMPTKTIDRPRDSSSGKEHKNQTDAGKMIRFCKTILVFHKKIG
jgi:hypothetical protein